MPEGSEFRLSELLSALSLVTDLGEGLPPETAVRTCAVATMLAGSVAPSERDVTVTYYMSLLKHVGCTSFAHERATLLGGDDMRVVAVTQGRDLTKPTEVISAALSLGRGLPPLRAAGILARAALHGGRLVEESARAYCEVAAEIGRRLGLGPDVEKALYSSLESWNGRGFPRGLRGEDIPWAAHCEHVAELAVYFDRTVGVDAALEAVQAQTGRWLHPEIAGAFSRIGSSLLREVNSGDPFEMVLELEPAPVVVGGNGLEDVAKAFGDVVDLKSPFLHGHSSGVAELASTAAGTLGFPGSQVTDLRLAALLHDLGRAGVSNAVWEKPGPLTSAQWDQVRLHPYHSERILLRSKALAPLARIAGLHHERQDGSGYHRELAGRSIPMTARILAAADAYQAMTSERPHRSALPPADAAKQLALEAGNGRFDREAAQAVLLAAGQRQASRRTSTSSALSDREVEVLLLATQGMSTRQIAQRLFVSPKTVDHHIQHIYNKIGVSTRAAAAMWAMEHGLV